MEHEKCHVYGCEMEKDGKLFVALLHLEVLILYIYLICFEMCLLDVFCNVLLMFPFLLQRFFFNHLFGQRFECTVHMVSQFLNVLQRFANNIYVLLHFFKNLFSAVSPLGSSTGYMSSGLTVADHVR